MTVSPVCGCGGLTSKDAVGAASAVAGAAAPRSAAAARRVRSAGILDAPGPAYALHGSRARVRFAPPGKRQGALMRTRVSSFVLAAVAAVLLGPAGTALAAPTNNELPAVIGSHH